MKIERLTNCVFWASFLCFVLQGIGYLSPGWFVREVSLKQSMFSADGRYFELPGMSSADYDKMELGTTTVRPTMYPMNTNTTAVEPTMYPRNTNTTAARATRYPRNTNTTAARATRATRYPRNTNTTAARATRYPKNTSRPRSTVRPSSRPMVTRAPSDRRPNGTTIRIKRTRPTTPASRPPSRGNSNGRQKRDKLVPTANRVPKKSNHTVTGNPNKPKDTVSGDPNKPKDTVVPVVSRDPNKQKDIVKEAIKESANNNIGDKARNMSSKKLLKGSPTLVHLSAGLWYGRACINSKTGLDRTRQQPGTEWCTLYVRTNTSTLDRQDKLFELRMEASFGIAFSVISLVLAGTLCCCKHHTRIRLAASVASLFVSGAVMAVPVVHVIVRHVTMHAEMIRKRNWGHMFINTHAQHDLFDHWSVILCGVASILSTVSTFVFAVLACRSDMKPRNKYDVGKMELVENSEKRNLKLSMIGNGKVTLPPETAFTEDPQIKADTPGDRDSACIITDSTAASATDGGDSISTDSFENAQEMTSFQEEMVDEIGHYVDIDDADEISETAEK